VIGRKRAPIVGDQHVDDELVVVRVVRAHEMFAFVSRQIADPARPQFFVPAFAPFGCDARRHRVCNLGLVRSALDELDEFSFGEACLAEQRRAQTRREIILAQITAAQRSAGFVDRARQEHEPGKPRARVARRAPAQADWAHRTDGSGRP
jgi:hypothetical protein